MARRPHRRPAELRVESLEPRQLLSGRGSAPGDHPLAIAAGGRHAAGAGPTTTISGRVVDGRGRALAGVPVEVGVGADAAIATTDARGRFVLRGVSAAAAAGLLSVDGPDGAARGVYACLIAPAAYLAGHPIVAGADNPIAAPLVLGRVDAAHATDFRRVPGSQAVDVATPMLPGVALHVAAGGATAAGRPYRGKLSLTALPWVPGSSLIEVDGRGVRFRKPATVTLPNSEGYAPGTVLDLVKMGQAGRGVATIGHLRVSGDGLRLETIDGGVRGSNCVIGVSPPARAAATTPPPSPSFAATRATPTATPIATVATTPAVPGVTATTPTAVPATPVATPIATPPVVATPATPTVLAVGSTLEAAIRPGGLAGDGVTYTISPQPLPDNATFDRGTGAFTFVPAPAQVGGYRFTVTVTAADGSRAAAQALDVSVVSLPRPSTEVSGQVVDESGRPLANVPVMIGGLGAKTDALGGFTIAGVPDRPGPLMLDGPHADAAGSYMMLMAPTPQFLGHPTYAGVANVVPRPIVLPKVDLAHATDFATVDASRARDLTSPALPGVVLHVAAGGARTADGRPFAGKLTLTALPVAQLREVLPPGVVPGSMVGVDGPELRFATPATITLPNTQGLAPGSILALMTMNMIGGGFDVTGHLRVSADGRSLATIDGGLMASSCIIAAPEVPADGPPVGGCGCDPPSANGSAPGGGLPGGGPPVNVITKASPSAAPLLASDADLVNGAYLQDYATAAYASQGQARGLDLQYSSLQADPRPVVQFEPGTQIASNSLALTSIDARAALGGSLDPAVTHPTPGGLQDEQAYRVPLQVDATALGTGPYPYSMTVTHAYGGTTTSRTFKGSVNVVNAAASPLGAGWSIGGLQHVYAPSPTGPALVTAGSRGTERFGYRPAGPVQDVAVVAADGTARLLRNDGTLGLTVPASGTAAAAAPVGAAAGDFNGDGRADLAELTASGVTILTANASGGLDLGATYAIAGTPSTVVVGNFTGHVNGVLDLAILRGDATIAVLPGNGNGTFGAEVDTPIAGGPLGSFYGSTHAMAAGDFNGDGRLDLAVTGTGDGRLRVVFGDGSGRFTASQAVDIIDPINGIPHGSVTVGNFTGHANGALDLAVVETVSSQNYPVVDLLTNNGTGQFSITGTFTSRDVAASLDLTAGDFYGDGQLDVALTGFYDGGTLVLPGSPSGTWGREVDYRNDTPLSQDTEPVPIVAADLNGDGRPDLILGDGNNGQLETLSSNPDANVMETMPTLVASGLSGAKFAAGAFSGRSRPARYEAMGDTSALARNPDGTWTRSYPDGTVVRFDTLGREVSEADRNGNATTYAYVASGPAAGALQTMTDPVGRVTTLAYDASGHISTITDPAGRVTTLTVDSGGNLTRAVDPAGDVTQYGYATPANHRITTEVSPNNRTATASYDGFGRLAGETLFDGTSTTLVGGAEEQGLLAAGGSGPLPLPGGYKGSVTDPNGHATTLTLDAMGHPIVSTDAVGQATTFARDMNGWVTSETDPWTTGQTNSYPRTTGQTRTTSYQHDMLGNVTRVTRPDGSSMTIAYNPTFSVPVQVTDFRGLTTTSTLDAHGNVTRRTDPDTLHEDWTYNAAGQVLTDTDRNGHVTTYHYDALGRVDSVTLPGPGGPSVGFTYDAAGDVLTATDELGHVTTRTYDPAGRVLTASDPVQAAAGQATRFAYDPDGNLTSVTDALGRVTTYTYDARDRVATMVDPANQGTGLRTSYAYDGMNLTGVTDPLGHQTTYAYDADNRPLTTTDALGHSTSVAYDAAGEVTSATDADGNITTYAYDNLGRLQSETLPDDPGGGTSRVYTFAYDPDGNPTSVTDPLGHVRSAGYDVLNRRTSATASPDGTTLLTTTSAYDPVGNLTSVTDPLNHATTYAYDARDRPIGRTAPAGGGTTSYAYDAHSRLLSVTDPVGNVTSYGYDNADRVTTATDPRSQVTATAYDLVGNAVQVTDRDGRVRQFGYDADNRPTAETWVGSSPSNTITTTYDAAGRTTGVGDAFSQYAYGYDAASRPTSVDDLGTPGLPRVVLTSAYDAADNRTALSDGLGGQDAYTYNARNRLAGLSQSGTSGSGIAPERVAIAYDAADRMTSLTRYSDPAGTQVVAATTSAYDGADRLTTQTNRTAGGATISSYGYTLDAAGRLTQEARTWNGGSATDTATFGYTADDQLTSAAHTNASFAAEGFGYDANGNRNTTGYSTGTGNRLTGDGTNNYAYDAEGNLITRTAIATGNQTLFKWDYRNRLTEVDNVVGGVTTTVARYTYDALNRPIAVVEGGATRYTLYDGQTPLLDFNGSGAVTARYLSVPGAIDEVLARQTSAGVAWYLTDRLGSVNDLISNSGAAIDHVDYGVFGTVLAESIPAAGDRFKYSGMELDAATGEYYDRARYYDAATGRFLDEDPSGFAGGDPDLYRFVGNSSTNSSDPSGLRKITREELDAFRAYYSALINDLYIRSISFHTLIDEIGGLDTIRLRIDQTDNPANLGVGSLNAQGIRSLSISADNREFRACGTALAVNVISHETIHILLFVRQNTAPFSNPPVFGFELRHNPNISNKSPYYKLSLLNYYNTHFPLGPGFEDLQRYRDRTYRDMFIDINNDSQEFVDRIVSEYYVSIMVSNIANYIIDVTEPLTGWKPVGSTVGCPPGYKPN